MESALPELIGERVRAGRQALRWTRDRLAEVSGVSRRMLVPIERGAANPSTGILLRISDALGVDLAALVEQPRQAPVTVTRSGAGPVLWWGATAAGDDLVAHLERLGPDLRVVRRLVGAP